VSGAFEAEIAIVNLEGYRSPGIDQILEKLIQAGSRKYMNLLIPFGKRKNCPNIGRSHCTCL
jgi:hypothetical protein